MPKARAAPWSPGGGRRSRGAEIVVGEVRDGADMERLGELAVLVLARRSEGRDGLVGVTGRGGELAEALVGDGEGAGGARPGELPLGVGVGRRGGVERALVVALGDERVGVIEPVGHGRSFFFTTSL